MTDHFARLTEAFPAAWNDGYEWAYDLKVGDDFRGSYGEGKHRGLEGDALTAFHLGASSGLKGWREIITQGRSIRIVKLTVA